MSRSVCEQVLRGQFEGEREDAGEGESEGDGGGGPGELWSCGAELSIGYQLWGHVIGRGLRFDAFNKDQETRISKGRLAAMN